MPFMYRCRHTDGFSYRIFKTEDAALAAIAKAIGRNHDANGNPLRIGRRYIDDNGGTHLVEQTTVTNARTMAAVERAFDARECGIASRRQLALLARYSY